MDVSVWLQHAESALTRYVIRNRLNLNNRLHYMIVYWGYVPDEYIGDVYD